MNQNIPATSRSNSSFWDWKLYLLILVYTILPSIYGSYSLYLIGNELPSTEGLAIVSQWQFVQVMLEIVQEATVLPIFYFLGSQIRSHDALILSRLKTSFTVIFLLASGVIILMLTNLDQFIYYVGADSTIIPLTTEYLSVKLWASLFSILNVGVVITIEALNKKKLLFVLILIKTIGIILLDSWFFGGYSFSLGMGIKGAAYSNLLIEAMVFVAVFILLLRSFKISFSELLRLPWLIDFKLFRDIGLGSGIESFVKNIAYFMLILKLINELGYQEISAYYLAMHLFWSFLLVPIMAGVETSRALISNHVNDLNAVGRLLKKALTAGAVILVVWVALTPLWREALTFFNEDPEIVELGITVISYLLIPYMLLAFNMLLDSLFYGLGKTQYMAYQSLITNGTVYLGAYLVYSAGWWMPDFESILILFGLGILVDSGLTVWYARRVLLGYRM